MAVSQKRSLDDAVLCTKHILMDIEGTTTSISFVKDTLFPYVRKNLDSYLDSHWNEEEFQIVLALLKDQAVEDKKASMEGAVEIPSEGTDTDIQAAVVKNVLWQMDSDRKTTALKKLQGHMWRQGYKTGDLKGHLFADVTPALREWVKDGRKLYIYSSGSVEAQKLLFGNSAEGDLLELFSDFFDTEVGAKVDVGSYKAIVERLKCNADDVLFLTDMPNEASAARQAGLPAILVQREGNEPISSELLKEFSSVSSFGDLTFEVSIKKQKVAEEAEAVTAPAPKSNGESQLSQAKESSACSVKLDVEAQAMDVDEPTNAPAASASTKPSDEVKEASSQGDSADATTSNADSAVETESVQVELKDKQSTAETAEGASSSADPKGTLLPVVDSKPQELKNGEETLKEIDTIKEVEKAVGETAVEKAEVKEDKTDSSESAELSVEESKTDKTCESGVMVAAKDEVKVTDAGNDTSEAQCDEKVAKESLVEENKSDAEKISGKADVKTATLDADTDSAKTEEIKNFEVTEDQKSEKETEASSVETEVKKSEAEKTNGAENKHDTEDNGIEKGNSNGTNGTCNGSTNGTSNGAPREVKELEEDGDVKNGHSKAKEDIPEVIVAKNVPQVEDAGVPIEA